MVLYACYFYTAVGGCPNGGTEFNGDCFYYVPTHLFQTTAEQNCNNTYNGHLASASTSDEWKFLQSIIV